MTITIKYSDKGQRLSPRVSPNSNEKYVSKEGFEIVTEIRQEKFLFKKITNETTTPGRIYTYVYTYIRTYSLRPFRSLVLLKLLGTFRKWSSRNFMFPRVDGRETRFSTHTHTQREISITVKARQKP